MRLARFSLVALLVCSVAGASALHAQSWLDKAKQKAKDKANQRVDQRTDEAIDKGIHKTEDAITCVVSDKACQKKAADEGKKVTLVDSEGNVVESQGAGGAGAGGGGAGGSMGVLSSFDFMPGDSIIFFEDFSRDAVNDFPKRLELMDGNFDVVQLPDGRKALRNTQDGKFSISFPDTLPDRFSVEVDYLNPQTSWEMKISPSEDGQFAHYWCYSNGRGGVVGGASFPNAEGETPVEAGSWETCRFAVNGRAMKAYINTKRIANMPRVGWKHTNKLIFEIPQAYEENPALITNIRVMGGGRDMYEAIEADGRVSTQGILFETGKAKIRPESGPTLRAIADMMKAHPDLKLSIEGHTDNVGVPAANQTLSEQRAAAVKTMLATQLGIDASRLQTKGFGGTKPVAPNDNAQNRQKNRRVELVKM